MPRPTTWRGPAPTYRVRPEDRGRGGVPLPDADGDEPLTTFAAFLAEERDRRARENATKERKQDVVIGFDTDPLYLERCAAEGLAARARRTAPPAGSWDVSFATLAHLCLVRHGRGRRLTPEDDAGEVVRLALASTDFPQLLGDTFAKVALPAYERARPAYRTIGHRTVFRDFKQHRLLKPAAFPAPLETGEHGEVTAGPLADAAGEVATLTTYSRNVTLSRQMLVNDDIAGFADLAQAAARRVVDLEDALVWDLLTSGTGGNGPTLKDGAQLFATSRGNLASTAAALSLDTLGAARAAVMKQTSPDGMKAVSVPRFLVVSPEAVTAAEEIVAKLAAGTNADFRLQVVPAVNLPSPAWMLFSSPDASPTLVYGHLGRTGPSITSEVDFNSDGVRVKVVLDFSAAIADWRGSFKNAGA